MRFFKSLTVYWFFSGLNIDASAAPTQMAIIIIAGTSFDGSPSFKLKQSYLKGGIHQDSTLFGFGEMSLEISDSVIESQALVGIRGFGDINLLFENSSLIMNSSLIIAIGLAGNNIISRIENVHIQSLSQKGITGLMINPRLPDSPRFRYEILIHQVDFSDGVGIPVDTRTRYNDVVVDSGLVNIKAGSVDNNWAMPAGDIASTGCLGSLRSGFIGFQAGIQCGSAPVTTAMPDISQVTTQLTENSSLYSRLQVDTGQDISPASQAMEPCNDSNRLAAGNTFMLLLLPLLMAVY